MPITRTDLAAELERRDPAVLRQALEAAGIDCRSTDSDEAIAALGGKTALNALSALL